MRHWLAVLTLSQVVELALTGQQPAPAKVQFIEIEPGVRLEVLDWGGSGRSVVLLAGGGDTAHVYDKFAQKLTADCHVFGITRRGFGASSRPETGYTAEALGNDVLHVLAALKLDRPVLVGHSVAGEELSSIGARSPGRVAALIYLDAAWDRTYVASKDTSRSDDFDKAGIPAEPGPNPGRFNPSDAIRAGVERPNYAQIRVPALAIYAAPRTWKEMMPDSSGFTDPEKQAAAERVVGHFARTRKIMEETFHTGVAGSRVVEIPGASHYVYRTNEADVLREMRAFLATIP